MLRFAWKNMLVKKGKLLLAALSILLSAGVALLAANISLQVHDGIVNTAAYYDIIIGPAGSSTQLAMNTMFFTDSPLGTIPYSVVEELNANPNVRTAVPFAMGDSYNGAKIVGTTPQLLEGKSLSEGDMFSEVFEAVVGADVAAKYGLRPGDSIVTSHGLSGDGAGHTATPLTVTGVLAKTSTAYDSVVFTSYKTVWAVHGAEEHEDGEHEEHEEHEEDEAHEGTVCAVLVRTKDFNSYYSVSDYYGQDANLLVINPSTVLREVLENVDLSSQIVYALCGVILVMDLLVISVITLMNLYDARKEIALMRLIGISMKKIALLYALENAAVALIAVLAALGASMLALGGMGALVAGMGIVLNAGNVYPSEWLIMLGVFLISVVPTLVCVWRMARQDGIGERRKTA